MVRPGQKDECIYPEGAVFYSSDKIPKREIIGYEMQMNALAGVACTVAGNGSKAVLVFGFPGTGKTMVPFAVARRMKETFDIDFSIAMIACNSIINSCTFCPDVALRAVERDAINAVVQNAIKNRPALICLDQIDAVPDGSELSARSHFFYSWLRAFLDRHVEKSLIMGIADYPSVVDPAVLRHFDTPIYFEPPSLETIQMMIERNLKKSRYRDLAWVVVRELSKLGLIPLGSNVVSACEALVKAMRDGGMKDVSRMSEGELVSSFLASMGPGASAERIREYERTNESIIRLSLNNVIPFWTSVYEKARGVGK